MLAFVGIPVYLFVMCICTGEVFLKLFGKGEGINAGKNIIAGYVICAGLFHIISTPFMYYELSFSPLVYICIAYSVVIIAAYIILKIKEEKTLFERASERHLSDDAFKRKTKGKFAYDAGTGRDTV